MFAFVFVFGSIRTVEKRGIFRKKKWGHPLSEKFPNAVERTNASTIPFFYLIVKGRFISNIKQKTDLLKSVVVQGSF